jgi:polyisoprenoid-binding protein YceI
MLRRVLGVLAINLVVVGGAYAQTYQVDLDKSKIAWDGNGPAKKHDGEVKFKSGVLTVKDDSLKTATFVADMNSITNNDLPGGMKEKLVGHLKSGDFFETKKYPEAKFEFESIVPNKSKNRYTFKGNLTLVGKTKPVEFSANVQKLKKGSRLRAVANFTINRTDWGIKYKSKNWFKNLGDKWVGDEIKLSVTIETKDASKVVAKKQITKSLKQLRSKPKVSVKKAVKKAVNVKTKP